MKNSKTMVLGLCVVLLVAMTGGIAVGADNTFSGLEGVEVKGATYDINIPADGYTFDIYSELADAFPGDYDLYALTVGTGCTAVAFSMMDCCIAGDTVAFGTVGGALTATSPMPACGGAYLPPGTYNIYAAYIWPNSGLFPMGYDMKIKGYWPLAGAKGDSNVE